MSDGSAAQHGASRSERAKGHPASGRRRLPAQYARDARGPAAAPALRTERTRRGPPVRVLCARLVRARQGARLRGGKEAAPGRCWAAHVAAEAALARRACSGSAVQRRPRRRAAAAAPQARTRAAAKLLGGRGPRSRQRSCRGAFCAVRAATCGGARPAARRPAPSGGTRAPPRRRGHRQRTPAGGTFRATFFSCGAARRRAPPRRGCAAARRETPRPRRWGPRPAARAACCASARPQAPRRPAPPHRTPRDRGGIEA